MDPADAPPADVQAAYAQLSGPGISLAGKVVLLAPAAPLPERAAAVHALIAAGRADWLAVVVQAAEEKAIVDLLCLCTSYALQATAEEAALAVGVVRSAVAALATRGSKVEALLRSMPASFIQAACDCAGKPAAGSMLVLWLEVSGEHKRALHERIFQDRALALNAARAGNLDVLKELDFGGYDVRRKPGAGGVFACCSPRPADVAKRRGHSECVAFFENLKNYPPPLVLGSNK
ncbi:unnamed protein product [Polarella glacialis]|uniref:Uncharacterized protein n=1 Tax=Polarella glacialis TaxID=89957 RepID=A0A813DTG6_POLGL|nr:unnamed protein product [Polarella glacialis]